MPRLTLFPLVTATALFAAVPIAQADYPNAFCRYYGIGWSDGYHSHTACSPKRPIVHHKVAPPPPPKPVPWWAIPAEQPRTPPPEELPTPAGQTPATTGTSSTSGRSLFRQSGDGSTVSELRDLSGTAAGR